MSIGEPLQEFLSAAESWVCDGYALDVRYVARPSDAGFALFSASIGLHPLKAPSDLSFEIETADFLVGQAQRFPAQKDDLLSVLANAARGVILINGKSLALPGNPPHSHYSESANRSRWFSDLHLETTGGVVSPMPSATQLSVIDNALRLAQPPFDGVKDAVDWLALPDAPLNGRTASIIARVAPPVDLILERCNLRGSLLTLVLHAHPSLSLERIGLAMRAVPGSGLLGRQQVKSQVVWGDIAEDRREGIASIHVENADQVLVMLMVGSATIRRHWFVEPARARNNRLLALQHFDPDLRKIRSAILDTSDSRAFEQGIASLLFLLGFSPVVQIETDAPDLLIATPSGRLAIVECTLRIADVAAKLGKLVDRRGSLSKVLANAGHAAPLVSVLVCRLPRDQIAALDSDIQAHRIVLVTAEHLVDGLVRARHPPDPDELLEAASASPTSAA